MFQFDRQKRCCERVERLDNNLHHYKHVNRINNSNIYQRHNQVQIHDPLPSPTFRLRLRLHGSGRIRNHSPICTVLPVYTEPVRALSCLFQAFTRYRTRLFYCLQGVNTSC